MISKTMISKKTVKNRLITPRFQAKIGASLFVLMLFSLSGCISKAPKTAFYTLAVQPTKIQAAPSVSASIENTKNSLVGSETVGVGPITLPEYIRNSQIVSFTSESRLHVASNAAWAGDVNANLTRVMGLYLSKHLPTTSVQTFPWDRRARPAYQLIVRFHQFGGVKGKSIMLDAQWQLINTKTKTLAEQGSLSVSEPLDGMSTHAYVAGLNRAVQTLTFALIREI